MCLEFPGMLRMKKYSPHTLFRSLLEFHYILILCTTCEVVHEARHSYIILLIDEKIVALKKMSVLASILLIKR